MAETSTAKTAADRFTGIGFRRREDDRLVAGVAGGIADRLGIDVIYIRAGFVVLGFVWGAGILAYLAAWAATLDQPQDSPADSETPVVTREQRLGLVFAFAGILLLLRFIGVWPGDGLVWPLAAVVFGIAFLLDQRAIDSRTAVLRLFDPHDGSVRSRIVIGVVLLVVGLAIFGSTAVPQIQTSLLAVLVTGVGLLLVFGPWVFRLAEDLGRERRERIRHEERAEMAAHLHDSVLQTLALIQRSDDPKRMVILARAQERELRRWLYERAASPGSDRLSTALQATADRVEADFDVPVETVMVGDVPLDAPMRAAVGAAGEALTNAAKHAGVDRISLYAEVTDDRVEIFISDQGDGFVASEVGVDRRGIAESIIARMERHGGTAAVASEPGEGTEVHLTVPRAPGHNRMEDK